MKSNSIFIITLSNLLPIFCIAQQASEIKVFRDKKVKLNVSSLYDVVVNADGSEIQAITYSKKGVAESVIFDKSLALKSVNEIEIDFEKDQRTKIQKKYGDEAELAYTENGYPYLILKKDVLYIADSFFGLKLQGEMNKIGQNISTGLNLLIQKGEIVQYGTSYDNGTYGSGEGISTRFVSRSESKLKSDEDKNVSYEFHKSNGEEFKFVNTSVMNITTYNYMGEQKSLVYSNGYADYYKVYDVYNGHTNYGKVRAGIIQRNLISGASGTMLLVAKRRPIIAFGKAPSKEDLLPYYYVYQIDSKTLEVLNKTKFQEPISRAIIFRNSLSICGGALLVSAPTNVTASGNIVPIDPDAKKYVFRHVTDDAKLNWEFEYKVPSGFTRFVNAVELPDSSIILYATVDMKKADNYYNKKMGVSGDGFYSMKIKNGKVIGAPSLGMEDFIKHYKTPQSIKPKVAGYDPQDHALQTTQTRMLDNGGMMVIGMATKFDSKLQKDLIIGHVIFHFDVNGGLANQFWIPSESNVKPELDPVTFQISEDEFLWLTFESKDEFGKFMTPSFSKFNLKTKTISDVTMIGDDKHYVTTKNPMVMSPDNKTMKFFGFDKGGKEFWTQEVSLQ